MKYDELASFEQQGTNSVFDNFGRLIKVSRDIPVKTIDRLVSSLYVFDSSRIGVNVS